MIKLNDLWVGDKLRIIADGRIGSYEGNNHKMAFINVEGKRLLIDPKNLEIYTPPPEKPQLIFKEEQTPSLSIDQVPIQIDLHIEKLNPQLTYEPAFKILKHQLEQLEKYIERVNKVHHSFVTIIHGKGKGVLKKEVHHFLKGNKKIKLLIDKQDGGATEVHFY